jgi:hypothetical protein
MTNLISFMIFNSFQAIVRKNISQRTRYSQTIEAPLSSENKMSFFYNFNVLKDCCFAIKNKSFMKRCIVSVLVTCLILVFTVLLTETGFSQPESKGHPTDSTGVASTLHGKNSAYVQGITTGRAKALLGVAAGILSLVTGWRALTRMDSTNGKAGAIAGLPVVLGLIDIILSIIHLSSSAGAVFGSGSGKAGPFLQCS